MRAERGAALALLALLGLLAVRCGDDDGPRRVLVAVTEDGADRLSSELRVFDASTGRDLFRTSGSLVVMPTWSQRGTYLAVIEVPDQGVKIRIFDASRWVESDYSLLDTSLGDLIFSIAWSPDEKYLALIAAERVLFLTPHAQLVAEARKTHVQSDSFGGGSSLDRSPWSPDSRYVAWVGNRSLLLADTRGGLQELKPADSGFPAFFAPVIVRWEDDRTLRVAERGSAPGTTDPPPPEELPEYRVTIKDGRAVNWTRVVPWYVATATAQGGQFTIDPARFGMVTADGSGVLQIDVQNQPSPGASPTVSTRTLVRILGAGGDVTFTVPGRGGGLRRSFDVVIVPE